MAETRRTSVKGYKRVDCKVSPECWAVLDRIAGARGVGYAIEQLAAVFTSALPAGEQRLGIEKGRIAEVK